MQISPLEIPHAFEITPTLHEDARGLFFELYRFDKLALELGHSLHLKQSNVSVSHKGVFRGLHFAQIPVGQAKYVTCLSGSAIDFVVDVRVGSPTFGKWDSVLLDTTTRKAVYLAEGLAHGFLSLEDNTTISYMVSDIYRADRELGINPLDPLVSLEIPELESPVLFSPKDESAPKLLQLAEQNLLPTWEECLDFYTSLKEH